MGNMGINDHQPDLVYGSYRKYVRDVAAGAGASTAVLFGEDAQKHKKLKGFEESVDVLLDTLTQKDKWALLDPKQFMHPGLYFALLIKTSFYRVDARRASVREARYINLPSGARLHFEKVWLNDSNDRTTFSTSRQTILYYPSFNVDFVKPAGIKHSHYKEHVRKNIGSKPIAGYTLTEGPVWLPLMDVEEIMTQLRYFTESSEYMRVYLPVDKELHESNRHNRNVRMSSYEYNHTIFSTHYMLMTKWLDETLKCWNLGDIQRGHFGSTPRDNSFWEQVIPLLSQLTLLNKPFRESDYEDVATYVPLALRLENCLARLEVLRCRIFGGSLNNTYGVKFRYANI